MSDSLDLNSDANEERASTFVDMDESLVAEMWQKVEGRVSRSVIRLMVLEAKNDFADASIVTYVHIFIRRQVRTKLEDLLKDQGPLSSVQTLHPTVEPQTDNGEDESSITAESDQNAAGWLLGYVS